MSSSDAKAGPGKEVAPEAREAAAAVDDTGTSIAHEAFPSPLHCHTGTAVLPDDMSTPPAERGALHFLCDRANFAAESWLMTTTTANHITPWASDFNTYTPYENPTDRAVFVGVETYFKVLGIGTVIRHVKTSNGYTQIQMKDVLHVDGVKMRFLSISSLSRHGFNVSLSNTGAEIQRPPLNFYSIGEGSDLWYWHLHPKRPGSVQLDAIEPLPITIWHERMGHLDWVAIKKVRNQISPLIGISLDDSEPRTSCKGCITGIWERRTFKPSGRPRATGPLEIIHSGLDGPMEPSFIGGSRCFVVFVDDYTNHVWVAFLKSKNQTLEAFKKFYTKVRERTGRNIKIFRPDRSQEFMSDEFSHFLGESKISRKGPGQQEVFAEHMVNTLLHGAQVILQHSGLPTGFWSEAVATAVYLYNRSPCESLSWKTPHELLNGRTPDISYLRVFGCCAWVHTPEDQRTKLDANGQPMIFVGYESDAKAYRFWSPRAGSTVVSTNARFDESFFPLRSISPF